MMDYILLIGMVFAALWTVMGRSLLKAAIGLAITSVFVTMIMFRLDSPLAAVFELSVCTGLITAIFVSAISLTKPLTKKEIDSTAKDRARRYWYLPVIMVLAGMVFIFIKIPQEAFEVVGKYFGSAKDTDVRIVLWNVRQLDVIGQIVVILAGAFGVVILFKEKSKGK